MDIKGLRIPEYVVSNLSTQILRHIRGILQCWHKNVRTDKCKRNRWRYLLAEVTTWPVVLRQIRCI